MGIEPRREESLQDSYPTGPTPDYIYILLLIHVYAFILENLPLNLRRKPENVYGLLFPMRLHNFRIEAKQPLHDGLVSLNIMVRFLPRLLGHL